MTGFADTLRGNGLAKAQRVLAGLQGDPLRLDRERRRFSQSPPPYTSDLSGTTTRSVSPNASTEQQWRRQERRMQLGEERLSSEPYYQFEHQVHDEKKRIMEANLNQTRRLRVGDDPDKIAHEYIKKCWVEQGIWNTTWNQFVSGRWKHEEPLEHTPELETDSEAESTLPPFPFLKKQPQAKSRLPKSDEEKRCIAQRRLIREREREASRPYHQFVYQVSKERERLQEDSANMEGVDEHINTAAYENIKNTWTKRGIWNGRWGILPWMSWKHEEPLEEPPEELLEEEAVSAPVPPILFGNDSHEAGDAPILNFYESPLGNNFGFPVTNLCESRLSQETLSSFNQIITKRLWMQ